MHDEKLDHLPASKRRELNRVVKILFESFEAHTITRFSAHRRTGRILKMVLFGSTARGDWVDDPIGGYKSDYDLLIVVNDREFTDLHKYWEEADDRLVQELTVTHRIRTPVNFIVYSFDEVNDQLARGLPFFKDIARDGVMLYEAVGHPLAQGKALTVDEIAAQAKDHFDHLYPSSMRRFELAKAAYEKGFRNETAFLLHQTTEALYNTVLLTLTLYAPKLHRLNILRSQAEGLDDRLQAVWPRKTRFAKRSFARLQRAYVDSRYSAEYAITDEELAWLTERVSLLQKTVKTICEERINS